MFVLTKQHFMKHHDCQKIQLRFAGPIERLERLERLEKFEIAA
jgi:hypothetical protein